MTDLKVGDVVYVREPISDETHGIPLTVNRVSGFVRAETADGFVCDMPPDDYCRFLPGHLVKLKSGGNTLTVIADHYHHSTGRLIDVASAHGIITIITVPAAALVRVEEE